MSETRTMTQAAAREIGMPYDSPASLLSEVAERPINRIEVAPSGAGIRVSMLAYGGHTPIACADLSESQALTMVQHTLRALAAMPPNIDDDDD